MMYGNSSTPTNGNGNGNGHGPYDGEGWHDRRLDLGQHVAVVTGGASGIGRATCIRLALEGVKAIGVIDMNDSVATFSAESNQRLGREVMIPFRGDVTNGEFRKSVFAEMERRFGVVSICVPAAGITRDRLAVRIDKTNGAVDMYPEEEFRRVIEIDLTAPIYWGLETISSVARKRRFDGKKKWEPNEPLAGAVIFIGSVSSTGNRGQISYASAKAGLEGAEATLASEAIFYGVRSAIIHPGYTDTAMVRAMGPQLIDEKILPQTQLRRLIYPEEIAEAICFMIRNAAVSGTLWADAGWHPMV